jgi:hypothetical protein
MPWGQEATVAHRGRPLPKDARRTRAWPVLAACVIVIATLGLLLRAQARPDGLDSVVDTAMAASFSGHQGMLPWLALPGSTIPLIAVSIAIAAGCLIAGRPNVARAALVVVACGVRALVAVGVVGLRWHYFTDTVGGVALGTGTVLTLAFLIDLVPGVMRPRGSGTALPDGQRSRPSMTSVTKSVPCPVIYVQRSLTQLEEYFGVALNVPHKVA